ncbi:MAG: lipopolysaccharide biosynthesis protein [Thermodesulfobacteriota bacterium]|nr:lipopolysaccharide biosynthesis protein [Thermodesulfobacteriota bacterium]
MTEQNKKPVEEFLPDLALRRGLKETSTRGGFHLLLSQVGQGALTLCSTVVLARLLVPEDFGLVGMGMVVINLLLPIVNLNLSKATIQRKELLQSQVSNLFWFNTAAGAFLALLVALSSVGISSLFNEIRLARVIPLLSISLLLQGTLVQHRGLMGRFMRFGRITCASLLAKLVSTAAAIGLALMGAGYWSLVAMQLIQNGTLVLGFWALCPWRPSLPSRGADTRSFFRFGQDLTLGSILGTLSLNLDQALIGGLFGPSTLGLYRKAHNLIRKALVTLRGPLTSVMLSAMSRLQDRQQEYRAYFSKGTALTAFIAMPLVAYLMVNGDHVVLLLLGEKWMGTVFFIKAFAVAGFFETVMQVGGVVLMSLGRTRKLLAIRVIRHALRLAAIVAGLHWGASGVATAYCVITVVSFVPVMGSSFSNTPVSMRVFLDAVWRPALCSIMMGTVVFYFRRFLPTMHVIQIVLVEMSISLVVYFVLWCLCPGGPGILRRYGSYGKLLFVRQAST